MKALRSPRGMVDLLPEQQALHCRIEEQAAAVLDSYGYREMGLPLAEHRDLFRRAVGASTDIVEKEMYSLSSGAESADSGESQSLSLRPEGTAGCLRAVIEHDLLRSGAQRLWYRGPMFRCERPQKGRHRQFHQLGAEAVGFAGAELDAELIAIGRSLWRRLGVETALRLEINALPDAGERQQYSKDLLAWLQPRAAQLDPDSRRRMERNPLRILDSKQPQTQQLLNDAPRIDEYLDVSSRDHFAELCRRLDSMNIPWQHNPRLVRGLDYYGGTVFEWLAERGLGAQNAVAAGGRYDNLMSFLGGSPAPAVGFALGVERLALLLQDCQQTGECWQPDAWLVGTEGLVEVQMRGEDLRHRVPGLRLIGPIAGSFKSQLRKADRSGAPLALICGSDEAASGSIGVRHLRAAPGEEQQRALTLAELREFLRQRVAERCSQSSY